MNILILFTAFITFATEPVPQYEPISEADVAGIGLIGAGAALSVAEAKNVEAVLRGQANNSMHDIFVSYVADSHINRTLQNIDLQLKRDGLSREQIAALEGEKKKLFDQAERLGLVKKKHYQFDTIKAANLSEAKKIIEERARRDLRRSGYFVKLELEGHLTQKATRIALPHRLGRFRGSLAAIVLGSGLSWLTDTNLGDNTNPKLAPSSYEAEEGLR